MKGCRRKSSNTHTKKRRERERFFVVGIRVDCQEWLIYPHSWVIHRHRLPPLSLSSSGTWCFCSLLTSARNGKKRRRIRGRLLVGLLTRFRFNNYIFPFSQYDQARLLLVCYVHARIKRTDGLETTIIFLCVSIFHFELRIDVLRVKALKKRQTHIVHCLSKSAD